MSPVMKNTGVKKGQKVTFLTRQCSYTDALKKNGVFGHYGNRNFSSFVLMSDNDTNDQYKLKEV